MAILAILLTIVSAAISYLIVAGLVALVCWAVPAWTFSWLLALGVWAIIQLIRLAFK